MTLKMVDFENRQPWKWLTLKGKTGDLENGWCVELEKGEIENGWPLQPHYHYIVTIKYKSSLCSVHMQLLLQVILL